MTPLVFGWRKMVIVLVAMTLLGLSAKLCMSEPAQARVMILALASIGAQGVLDGIRLRNGSGWR